MFKLCAIFLLASLLVAGSNALSTSEMTGDYAIECSELAGLPDGWRISERQVLRGSDWTAISIIYSDQNCFTEALRYDRGFTYKIGSRISEDDWEGSGARAYRDPTYRVERKHWRKVMTPLSTGGASFLNTLCSSTTFASGRSSDVFDLDCAPFFYTCPDEDDGEAQQTEHICVHYDAQDEEDDPEDAKPFFIQCQRGETGSCSDDDAVLDYYPNAAGEPLIANTVSTPFSDEQLDGYWTRKCSSVVGFPSNIRVSTKVSYSSSGAYKSVNIWYNAEPCDDSNRILYMTAKGKYYLGLELDHVVADLAGMREQDIFYTEKKLWYPSQEAVDFLNEQCPGNNFDAEDIHRDMLNVDCAPLFFSCSDWQNSDIGCIATTATGHGLVSCAGQSIIEVGGQGCAPDDRGQFPLITAEGQIFALGYEGSASTLAISALLLIGTVVAMLF